MISGNLVGVGAIPLTGDNSMLNAYETILASGVGLQGFIRDMLFNYFKLKSKTLVIILTFLPSLAISYFYPDIFLKALDIVGGVGIVTLFCVFPVLLTVLDKSSSRTLKYSVYWHLSLLWEC